MDAVTFEGQDLIVNSQRIGRITNISMNNDGLYSCDIEGLDLSEFEELNGLLKSYDDTFRDLSLMLLDPIQEEIMSKFNFKAGETELTYIHLTEGNHLGFRI